MYNMGDYFAIEVPLRWDAEWFKDLIRLLRNVPMKWQRDIYHITMSFIQGDPDYASGYVVMVQRQLVHYHAQSLTFDKLGVFTTKSGEHIVYLTASHPDKRFMELVNMIRGEVSNYDVKQTDFRLHVTLGRIEAGKISLAEVQRLVNQVQMPSFTLSLTHVYHRLQGSKHDHKSWELT